ncbi:MAG: sigma-70 family RNA polymerase sigma factor [Pseudonocardiaceae bacterium]|nr:sigma-70 family RNA polymerase sigma factor [Pseudonocardiaceae bacterium]
MLSRARRAPTDDAELLRRIRAGQDTAFGELFAQHADAVRRFARGLTSDRAEAEDLTAETFFRVLQALRRGAGPSEHIRGYLLTVARRVASEWWVQRRDVPVSDDELTRRAGIGGDTHGRTTEHNLITRAFTSLPERWRSVLWQVEVEGERPAVVAPKFGLSPNATAALARRARRGLRAAYLQAHLTVHRSPHDCRSTVEKLGAYTAGTLRGAEESRVDAHLAGCADCRATHDELRDVCFSLRAHAGSLLVPASIGMFAMHQAGGSAGMTTALKGALIGTRVKVGVAVASSAAAGAFGVAVGPITGDSDSSQALRLPSGPSQELRIETPPVRSDGSTPVQQPDQPSTRADQPDASPVESVEPTMPGPTEPPTVLPSALPKANAGGGLPERHATAPRDDLPKPPGGDRPGQLPTGEPTSTTTSSRTSMPTVTEPTDSERPTPTSSEPTTRPPSPAPTEPEPTEPEPPEPTEPQPTETQPPNPEPTVIEPTESRPTCVPPPWRPGPLWSGWHRPPTCMPR